MIEQKLITAVRHFGLLEGVGNVTVACSGGADSMSLLHALLRLRGLFEITVSAAHFNHGIRGDEADRDERFVRETCERYGIPCRCGHGDAPAYAREHHIGLELAARELRYAFLQQCDGVIATAHTASDNLETVLFHLARGTALPGLCGIPPKRDRFIRPLLWCTRDEVEAYCRAEGIDYMTDSTNLSDDYTRNRLRHYAAPPLREVNPSVETAVSRTCALLAQDNDYMEQRAGEEYVRCILPDGAISTDAITALHSALAGRVLKRYLCENGCDTADSRHLTELVSLCKKGGRLSLPGGTTAVVWNARLTVSREKDDQLREFSVTLREISADFLRDGQKVHNLLLKNSLDCDKIIGQLKTRTREPGDSICLPNRNGTKTLKKLCNEYKIPLEERPRLPVLADDRGVVWAYRIGPAARCAVDQKTVRVLSVRVTEK